MSLISWNKISALLAPEFKQAYHNYLLVLGKKDDSSATIRSNYNYLKNQLSEAIEVKNNNATYLILDPNSVQVKQAEILLSKIKDEEFLDIEALKSEQNLDNLHHHKPSINCGLCHKPLSYERSVVNTVGPICEHRVQEIVTGEIEEPNKFESLYADSVDKGELVWLKIKNQVQFVEIIKNNHNSLIFLDRKSLEQDLKNNSNYTEVLKQHLHEVSRDEVQGVARLVPKKVQDKLFDDLMEIFK